MILVDTNVISELMKQPTRVDPRVSRWLNSVPEDGLATTCISFVESLFGVESHPDTLRRTALRDALEQVYQELFGDRILPFDQEAGFEYVALILDRKRQGRPILEFDAQIAAIARARGFAIATRDRDFATCGIDVINPWDYTG